MRNDDVLPGYETIFGDITFRPGAEPRSVYSPAAYLAELLQLLGSQPAPGGSGEGGNTPPELIARRPDLEGVPLDAEHTYTELPYLDIVNEVLARQVGTDAGGTDAYEALAAGRYPFSLPFSLRHERLRRHLDHLGVDPVELYRQFADPADPDTLAREALGLTADEVALVTTELAAGPELRACYGLADGEGYGVLAAAERFRRASLLTAAELRELVYQNLCVTPAGGGPAERSAAGAFFVNGGGDPVTLDDDETSLQHPSGEVPVAWWERANRFVRLARRTGLPFADLDLVLRACCGNRIDLAALRRLAVVRDLHRGLDLPVDVVVSLVAPLPTLGIGNDAAPQDLFDRVFNVPYAAAEQTVLRASALLPPAYQGLPVLACRGDLLADRNAGYLRRVATALGLAPTEVSAVVRRYRRPASAEPRPFDGAEIDLAALSLLHRVSRLAAAVGLPVGELFGLLDALDSDPSVRRYPPFRLLVDTGAGDRRLDAVLSGTDADAGLWLVQTLVAAAGWMRASGLGSADLLAILGGSAALAGAAAVDAERDTVLAALAQQIDAVALAPGLFVSDRFGERAAQAVYGTVAADAGGLVSAADHRLLHYDRARATEVGYTAVTGLGVVVSEDFEGLGLGERLTGKLLGNLVARGYVDGYGVVAPERLPATAAELSLAEDFEQWRTAVFDLIAGVCAAAAAGTGGDGDAATGVGMAIGEGMAAGMLTGGGEPADAGSADADFSDADLADLADSDLAGTAPLDDGATDVDLAATEELDTLDLDAVDPDAEWADASWADLPDPDLSDLAPAETAPADSAPADADPTGDDAEVTATDLPADIAWLFPSDLARLDDPPAAAVQAELYDNLVVNGYLDADGTVLDPDFFADPANAEAFTVNADLGGIEGAVYALLRDRAAGFGAENIPFDPAVLGPLPLTDAQRTAIVESLRFNGYLSPHDTYQDPRALIDLAPARFDLALEFYPYRAAVLAAVQDQLEQARIDLTTVIAADLDEIVDTAVAERVQAQLADTHLTGGRISAEQALALADPATTLELPGRTPAENATVLQRLATIAEDQRPYRFDPAPLAELGLDETGQAGIIGLLTAAGDLADDLAVPADRLAYFGSVHSVHSFALPGYEDFGTATFFLLHDLAADNAGAGPPHSSPPSGPPCRRRSACPPTPPRRSASRSPAARRPRSTCSPPPGRTRTPRRPARCTGPTAGSGRSPSWPPSSGWTRPRSRWPSGTRTWSASSPSRWCCRPASTASTRCWPAPTATSTCSATSSGGPTRPAPTACSTRGRRRSPSCPRGWSG
jgi:Salmonella virulence plasmid 28.1kDa A protein